MPSSLSSFLYPFLLWDSTAEGARLAYFCVFSLPVLNGSGSAIPDDLWLNPGRPCMKALRGGLLTLLSSLTADPLSPSSHTVTEEARQTVALPQEFELKIERGKKKTPKTQNQRNLCFCEWLDWPNENPGYIHSLYHVAWWIKKTSCSLPLAFCRVTSMSEESGRHLPNLVDFVNYILDFSYSCGCCQICWWK